MEFHSEWTRDREVWIWSVYSRSFLPCRYVNCAERGDTRGACADLKICVARGTTFFDTVRKKLEGEEHIYPADTIIDSLRGLNAGHCNVVAALGKDLTVQSMRRYWTGEYSVSTGRFSTEPLTPVVRQNDPEFASFVYWVISATMYAEEKGITQSTAEMMPEVNLFGPRFVSMFQNVIQVIGNYGEIYDRSIGKYIERSGANLLSERPFGPSLWSGVLN